MCANDACKTENSGCGCGCGCDDHHEGEGSSLKRDIGLLAAAVLLTAAAALLPLPTYLSVPTFVLAYLLAGYDVLWRAVSRLGKGGLFDENFLMSVATVAALAIGQFTEAVGVMVFYKIGELFLDRAVDKSRDSIASLLAIRPDFARLLIDGEEQEVAPETVQIGDCIVVRPGERIPLDGVVEAGTSFADTSSLTGESVPRELLAGDEALAGYVNGSGRLRLRVTRPFGQSALARILELTEHAAAQKAPTERFITRFAKRYTPVVVALAALITVVPCFFAGFDHFSEYLYRGIVFLVVSCPCALVLSVPLSFFAGIGGSAKQGVLFKGGNYLEAVQRMDTLVTDKTGTLTAGVFRVTATSPADGVTAEELLQAAARAEYESHHPIARSIAAACPLRERPLYRDYREEAGYGVTARTAEHRLLAGNEKLLQREGVAFPAPDRAGSKLLVAVDGRYLGVIYVGDELREGVAAAVAAWRRAGVRRIVMLTGDNAEVAAEVGHTLGLDGWYGGLLPHEKLERLRALQAEAPGRCGYIGDGINDAPALVAADIGIAMGLAGSDAAIESAGLVLMQDDLQKVATAKQIAARTTRIVRQNIVFALAVKVAVLALASVGLVGMWPAVFADVGVALLAVLNSTRALSAPH